MASVLKTEGGKTSVGSNPTSSAIFVFGSNIAGRHGKGAALFALKNKGAIYGRGTGMQGQSYAIPTKDANLHTLPLIYIKSYVDSFISFARDRPGLRFEVTPIGCGLAGYQPSDIAPMFADAPSNCILPQEFVDYLTRTRMKKDVDFR